MDQPFADFPDVELTSPFSRQIWPVARIGSTSRLFIGCFGLLMVANVQSLRGRRLVIVVTAHLRSWNER